MLFRLSLRIGRTPYGAVLGLVLASFTKQGNVWKKERRCDRRHR